ncbi:MAG: hypothetical protein JWQ81_4105 [Amycolatopsis sp.]|uniref:hypothetical protein n=1 Tax=Amycolatopsis sp. TaxID=37632 RepID=UPI002605C1A6|nr:hypothetical protein [Amycolatopsis sp.]MCU1683366.1 hypothetical protein [Amycolatopsis sp.]
MKPFADTARSRRRAARPAFAAVLFATAAVLSACGGAANSAAPQVASLPGSGAPSASATTSSPSTVDQSQRPQLRLDSTQEEIVAAGKPYDICLKEHGHKMIAGRGDGNSPDQHDDTDTAKAAVAACAGKLPIQPPEMDQSTNPHFLDDYHDWITCLNAKGVPVTPTDPFGSGWTFTSQPTVGEAQEQKIEQDCKIGAFSGK